MDQVLRGSRHCNNAGELEGQFLVEDLLIDGTEDSSRVDHLFGVRRAQVRTDSSILRGPSCLLVSAKAVGLSFL